MKADTYPLQVLLWTFSGWVNRHQQEVIAYLVEENRVLKEQMKGRRFRLTNEQRRRLAAKGKRLGRKTLNRVATIVTPDTIVRWHRRLISENSAEVSTSTFCSFLVEFPNRRLRRRSFLDRNTGEANRWQRSTPEGSS